MIPEYLKIAGIVVGSVILVAMWSPIGDRLARRSLESWARDERLRLIAFKQAPFWRGPRAWWRTENQEDYYVIVEDRHGNRRTGWVLYSWPWHGLGPPKKIEVRWEDELIDQPHPRDHAGGFWKK